MQQNLLTALKKIIIIISTTRWQFLCNVEGTMEIINDLQCHKIILPHIFEEELLNFIGQ